MITELLSKAVTDRKVVAFDYDEQPRLVEPHALGVNKKGQFVLRAFQVTGGSATESVAWKLFTVEKMVNVQVLDLQSHAPRPGYKVGDRAMVTVLAELPEVIEGNGEFRAGHGAVVTDWAPSQAEAVTRFYNQLNAAESV